MSSEARPTTNEKEDEALGGMGYLGQTVLEVTGTKLFRPHDCCEDCPDNNDNPPKESDCPNFSNPPGLWPTCSRPGNTDQQLASFLSGIT